FMGKITKWNDPELKNANPNVNLPDKAIVVLHRSEGSGTTYVWADYLSKVNPEWKTKVGVNASLNWPVGLGAKGNEGVAGLVKQTAYSIGYVELIYAIQNNMSYGRIRNSAGNFVKADLASVTAAASGAAKHMPADFRVSITNPPGKDAYPIASFTWLLIPADWKDKEKQKVIVDFLNWMLEQGQTMTAQLNYAPLPDEVKQKEREAIKSIH